MSPKMLSRAPNRRDAEAWWAAAISVESDCACGGRNRYRRGLTRLSIEARLQQFVGSWLDVLPERIRCGRVPMTPEIHARQGVIVGDQCQFAQWAID